MSKTLKETAQTLRDEGMRCFCDLDNWQPERDTGHSFVCPINEKAHQIHGRPGAIVNVDPEARRLAHASWHHAGTIP